MYVEVATLLFELGLTRRFRNVPLMTLVAWFQNVISMAKNRQKTSYVTLYFSVHYDLCMKQQRKIAKLEPN